MNIEFNTGTLNVISFPKLGWEFNVHEVALSIGNFRIAWYGILIALGILLAMVYAFSQCKKFGIIDDKLMDAGLGGIIGGIVGARLYYVAFSWDSYKDNLASIFKPWEGGMAIYGGLIGGLLVGILIAKWRKIKLLPALDVACMSFFIGQAIGRWGNFVNAEAFGGNTDLPWGMSAPAITSYLQGHLATLESLNMHIDPAMPVHPCFLYESLWCALGFLLLSLYRKHRKFDGEMFLMYSAWYGLGRVFIEGLRTDSLLLGKIRISQLLAGLLVLASVIIWAVITSRIRTRNDPEYLKLYVNTEGFQKELAEYELARKKKKGAGAEEASEEKAAETGGGEAEAAEKAEEDSGLEVVEIESFSGEEIEDVPEDDGTVLAEEKKDE